MHQLRRAVLLLALSPALGCGGSSTSTSIDAGNEVITCEDGMGNPASTCAVHVTESHCSLGDANACAKPQLVEVLANDGKNGVCLHVVIVNDCSQEIFTFTCIKEDATSSVPQQCWTSSTPPGATIDVSQCHATGAWTSASTTSTGQEMLIEQKCPAAG